MTVEEGSCHLSDRTHIDPTRKLIDDDEQHEEDEPHPSWHEILARHDAACIGYLFGSFFCHVTCRLLHIPRSFLSGDASSLRHGCRR